MTLPKCSHCHKPIIGAPSYLGYGNGPSTPHCLSCGAKLWGTDMTMENDIVARWEREGLKCVIRDVGGPFAGYVGVPEGHVFFEKKLPKLRHPDRHDEFLTKPTYVGWLNGDKKYWYFGFLDMRFTDAILSTSVLARAIKMFELTALVAGSLR